MKVMTKKTINLSKLDYVAYFLSSKKIRPNIKLLEKIKGRGINDLIPYKDSFKDHSIRRLDYADHVILECIIQTKDKDLDDFIISKSFEKTKVPKDWLPVIIK